MTNTDQIKKPGLDTVTEFENLVKILKTSLFNAAVALDDNRIKTSTHSDELLKLAEMVEAAGKYLFSIR